MTSQHRRQQAQHSPSPERDAGVASLLDELARVPASLTPGDTRAALAEAIRTGEVDGLYRPLGSPEWNVTLAALPPYVDPRMKLSAWVAHWQAGRSPIDAHLAAYTETQARIWQTERQRLQEGGQPR